MKIEKIKLMQFGKHIETELELNSVTLIKGCNGAGKSSIIEGINFALLGKISKTNKKLEDIFKLSNNGKEFFAELTTSCGTIKRGIVKDKKITEELITSLCDPNALLTEKNKIINSTFNINEDIFITSNFINLTDVDKSKYILSLVRDNNVDKDFIIKSLEKQIPIDIVDEFKDAYDDEIEELENINNLIKFANSLKNSLSKELRSNSEDIYKLADIRNEINNFDKSGLDKVEEFRNEINEIKVKLAISKKNLARRTALSAELEWLKKNSPSMSGDSDKEIAKIKEELNKCYENKSDTTTILAKINQVNKSINEIREVEFEEKNKLSLLQNQMEDLIEHGKRVKNISQNHKCVADSNIPCLNKTSFNSALNLLRNKLNKQREDFKIIQEKLEGFKNVYDAENKKLQALNEILNLENSKREENSIKVKMLTDNLEKIRIAQNKTVESRKKMDSISSQLAEIPFQDTTLLEKVLEAKEDELKELSEKKEKLVKLNINLTMMEKVDKQLEDKNIRLNSLKTTEKALKDLKLKCLNEGIIPFVDKMNEILADIGYTQKAFVESDGKKAIFGFETNSKKVPFNLLSTGESMIFLIGLLGAIYSNNNNTIRYLALDDIDNLDKNNLDLVLSNSEKLTKYFDNIILIGVLDKNFNLKNYNLKTITLGKDLKIKEEIYTIKDSTLKSKQVISPKKTKKEITLPDIEITNFMIDSILEFKN